MTPVQCIWTGEVYRPTSARMVRLADEQHGRGEVVDLEVIKPRSKASHDHFFAVVQEAWETLPDQLSPRFPTAESLRHWALCEAGFCDVKHYGCASRAEAVRWLPRVQAMSPAGSQIVVSGSSIVVREPQSQSMKAMGAKVFQESKSKCLEVIAGLLDTTPDQLARAA